MKRRKTSWRKPSLNGSPAFIVLSRTATAFTWFVKAGQTFLKECIYVDGLLVQVMEFHPGGDLLSLLNRREGTVRPTLKISVRCLNNGLF